LATQLGLIVTMGKNIIQQARGRGGPRYRAPSFKYKAEVSYPNEAAHGEIVDLIKCRGHSSPIAQVKYDNGEETYIVAAEGIRVVTIWIWAIMLY